ncbi:carbohydrate ABC transporter permease [Paenibacillus alginolyticus]|uniref:Carbohydrate ABC transporter permease n=1 Tax=Paenibacillus alginolyticus TaxID=59839 RepID=A0ABT4GQ93_9BACL|nr:carbohydrate ABC transporter permease [Paenibacillus alginolyticus]MCY9670468.1 carbohydrate ABC transporter permease [Paenibacillus alginolyticus]MCY9698226.1 carbohydrate ABC transporter permease [Paenibacillus alginolyticus]MEC0147748.1 carbohydrate ABC transporter permease [Paenibacillus alginolyticus]
MKTTNGEKLFYVFNYIILTCAGLSCFLPLVHLLSVSLSDPHAILSGKVSFWPVGLTLETYQSLFKGTRIDSAFINSVIITVVGVALSMSFTVMASYPLSKKGFYAKRTFTLLIVFTMLFSGGTIPTFLLLKSLGIINTYWALWLPGLISTYNMLIMRTFFENVPDEIVESAKMDGCSEFGQLFRIILPLSMPVIATLTLFYSVGYWNSFSSVMIFIHDSTKYNLAVLVQQMVQSQSMLQEMNNLQAEDMQQVTPESIKAAALFVMLIPMLVVYPFLQKYFVKGVMIGAVKG